MRAIAKEWMRDHKEMGSTEFKDLLESLIQGQSATEKTFAGIMLDLSTKSQRQFDPVVFEDWLDDLIGWAEVDSVCTGAYTITAIPSDFGRWKKILNRLSKSDNINKRRASIVFLCSPVRRVNDEKLGALALEIVHRLKHERHILITKAVSWLLRSMVTHHKTLVKSYLDNNASTLPAIAVRETRTKLRTGKKTARKKS